MASTKLLRSQGTPTNNKIFTVSCWFKAAQVANEMKLIYSDDNTTNNYTYIHFSDTSGRIRFQNRNSSSNNTELIWQNYIRDFSAFYHLVIAVDSTQATASDRVKFYLNGVQQTTLDSGANTFPPQNQSFTLNSSGYDVEIGAENSSAYFEGLMSYFAFVDGTAYDASYFGETDSSSGIWKIKTAPSVTYGNNGFFLKMDTTSPGSDTSGNNNTFTASGTPTLTQDNASNNFATWNKLVAQGDTFTNGNTTITRSASSWRSAFGSIGLPPTGKWYWEVKLSTGTNTRIGITDDIAGSAIDLQNRGQVSELGEQTNSVSLAQNGSANINTSQTSNYSASFTSSNIIGVAVDMTNMKLYYSVDGVFQNSGVPTSGSTGTGALTIPTTTGTYFPGVSMNASGYYVNFGNGFFGTTAISSSNADAAGHGLMEYAVPTGYYTLCTKNLNTYG